MSDFILTVIAIILEITIYSFTFSGYDFGYLIKLLTDTNLPQDEGDFFELLRIYFPVVYDVKVITLICLYYSVLCTLLFWLVT